MWAIVTQKITILLQLCGGAVIAVLIGLFVVLSVPIYILRLGVILLAKWTRPDLDGILVPLSAIMATDLLSGRPPRFTLVSTLKLQGKITLDEVKRHVTQNWIEARDEISGDLVYKRFRQYPQPWMGFTFWRDATSSFQFNLDEHIHFHDNLESPYVSEEDLAAFQEKLLNEPYPPQRSPWDLHIIANYKNPKVSTDPMFLVTFKSHHSLTDGFSVLACLVEGLLQCPLNNLNVPRGQHSKPTFVQNLAYYVALPFTAIYSMLYAFSTVLRHNPWRVPYGKRSWRQIVTKLEPIPTDRIKVIRKQFGVAFSAVLISAIGTAFHQGMSEDKDKRGSELWICPQPLSGHTLRLTNHFTAVGFVMPTTSNNDLGNHLQYCNTRLNQAKRSGLDLLIRLGFLSIGSHLLSVINLCTKFNAFAPIVLASLPGPGEEATQLELCGRQVLGLECVGGTLDGQSGIGITVFSFGHATQIYVIADSAVMSKEDLANVNKLITEEINVLYDEAMGKTPNRISSIL